MTTKQGPTEQDEVREFALVLRRALLLIVKWIEKRYSVGKTAE